MSLRSRCVRAFRDERAKAAVTVLAKLFFRHVLHKPLIWGDEAARSAPADGGMSALILLSVPVLVLWSCILDTTGGRGFEATGVGLPALRRAAETA